MRKFLKTKVPVFVTDPVQKVYSVFLENVLSDKVSSLKADGRLFYTMTIILKSVRESKLTRFPIFNYYLNGFSTFTSFRNFHVNNVE